MTEHKPKRVLAKSANHRENKDRPWFLGSPPVLPGEDAAAYDKLLARVRSDVNPQDVIGVIWVCRVVDLVWHSLRVQRFRDNLICEEVDKQVLDILCEAFSEDDAEPAAEISSDATDEPIPPRARELYLGWIARDEAAMKDVKKLVAATGTTVEGLERAAYVENLEKMEHFNREIAIADAHVDARLREIDRRQTTLAQTLRRVVQDIDASDYKVIEEKAGERLK